ncbi:MAG: M56 family metallopeptidase [Chitinophagaceae bacterium]
MQSVFAYHFLQSLSFALLNSLWQMAFLWVIYNVITTCFTLKSSTNFRLLVAMQSVGFSWFIYTLIVNVNSNNTFLYKNVFSINNSFIQEKLLPLIAVIYLFFAFVFLVKLFFQFNKLKGVRSNDLSIVSNKWHQFINEAKDKIGINRNIQIKISKRITTPLTIGFIKPIILLPVAAINNLTPHQLETILLHELAHIKRNDYIVNLLIQFVNSVMFFNPFSKFIGCLIEKERELSCDDEVLKYNYSNSLYAEALLSVAKFQLENKVVFGMTAVNTKQQELKHRIARILDIETENRNASFFTKQIGYSFFFGILLFTLIGFININVKKVIDDGVSVVSNNNNITFLQSKSRIFNQPNHIEPKVVKKVHLAKKAKDIELFEDASIALKEKRKIVEKGLQFIGKLATENDIEKIETVALNSEIDATNQELNTEDFVVTPTIDKHPTTTTQRFFVPATSKSAASIIVVTTTEKEDGKKVVKIEIEKGDGKVQ